MTTAATTKGSNFSKDGGNSSAKLTGAETPQRDTITIVHDSAKRPTYSSRLGFSENGLRKHKRGMADSNSGSLVSASSDQKSLPSQYKIMQAQS